MQIRIGFPVAAGAAFDEDACKFSQSSRHFYNFPHYLLSEMFWAELVDVGPERS
jgi:hypothetical protein